MWPKGEPTEFELMEAHTLEAVRKERATKHIQQYERGLLTLEELIEALERIQQEVS